MSNVFGKFKPYNTIIHRLDPRLKFFALIALMVMCFLPYGNYANRFIVLGVLALIIVVIMIIAKINPVSIFSSLKSLWVMMIFLLIIFVFVQQGVDTSSLHPMIIFPNGYTLYWEGLLQTLHVFLRLILMLCLTLILTSTTAPMDITYALDWYLYPLKLIKFPTQIVTMIISLALRFIPTLLDESQKIMKAQKSRGVDYNRGFISKKIKSITTLIIPLLVSCFSRSVELSLAMDARGYDPYGKRTSYKILQFHVRDLVSLFVTLLIMSLFIMACAYSSFYPGADNILKLLFGVEAF